MNTLKQISNKLLSLLEKPVSNAEQIKEVEKQLEITTEREKLSASRTVAIEDPSIKEAIFSPNQSAYMMDAEQFC